MFCGRKYRAQTAEHPERENQGKQRRALAELAGVHKEGEDDWCDEQENWPVLDGATSAFTSRDEAQTDYVESKDQSAPDGPARDTFTCSDTGGNEVNEKPAFAHKHWGKDDDFVDGVVEEDAGNQS